MELNRVQVKVMLVRPGTGTDALGIGLEVVERNFQRFPCPSVRAQARCRQLSIACRGLGFDSVKLTTSATVPSLLSRLDLLLDLLCSTRWID